MSVENLITRVSGIKDHAVICGYGPVGRRMHESLGRYGIPCIIIDLNADTVKSLLNGGHLAFLGTSSTRSPWSWRASGRRA